MNNTGKSLIEIYSNGRYFTFTGNIYGKLKPIAERTVELQSVYESYLKGKNLATQQQFKSVSHLANGVDINPIIEKAFKAANGAKFEALLRGEWERFNIYPSHSEADHGFCDMLAYWTDCDANLMDAIFRSSGLMRDKWDEMRGADTYGNCTIKKAISHLTSFKKQSIDAISNASSVKPMDFTDVGNANVFSTVFKNKLIYCRSLGFLTWTGQYWLENDLGALTLAMDLSEKMLEDSQNDLTTAHSELAVAESLQNANRIRHAKDVLKQAQEYNRHALRTREAPKILRMLELAKPALHKELDKLDSNPFILNTPSGFVDLRTGNMYPHAAEQLCTKITNVSPNTNGYQMWLNFLQWVTCSNKDMQDYLQMIVGMAAVGKVYQEALDMAIGCGNNGKSTFFNTVNTVLGTYGGNISPEVLTTSRSNKSAEIMTLKGKRLIVAAESEEGEYLSSSMLKRLVSVDRITGERKYRDPESFTPSHSLVLFTNHLPKVTATDNGTWRRIRVLKFNATIQPQNDIKNFGDVLLSHSGGAILDWIIKGSVKFLQNGCNLITPQCVIDITNQYRHNNDWMKNFIQERCECEQTKSCMSGELYSVYRSWAESSGEITRCKQDFNNELKNQGFSSHRVKKGVIWHGISLLPSEHYE